MSLNQSSGSGHSTPGGSSSREFPARPGYMTVGSGSTSESAARLQALLDDDSGYGGSMADGDFGRGWHPGLTADSPIPMSVNGEGSDNDRRILAAHVHQLYYNQNKNTLGRAITRTVETLKKLQQMNAQWPAHYPSVHRPESPPSSRSEPRPRISHTQSDINSPQQAEFPNLRRQALKRADTSLGDDGSRAESSEVAAQRATPEPRLVTPQLAQDFSILKIDLKMGGLSQTELVHSLEKQSIASLLDGQISKGIRHLYSLQERIEDTSSKVLVTGDLNAGKSTFCNALLRKKVLPEDQQPCTSIFCEVLDVRENGGLEEVHAIPAKPEGLVYNRNDESTYSVFSLKELETIVTDNERWSQCKVYVKDIRSVDESLLNNGVVDIALIDAPGLNNDSLKTTAIFARQEEIDVVVFVVSAANHFTQSAKEFIFNAAREKAYIFMVVNGFDNIRDKKRCQEMILKQVAHLSPATFKESAELVHFVSSNAIPTAELETSGGGGGGGGGGSGSSSGLPGEDPDGDGDDDETEGKHGDPGSPADKGKGKEREKIRDFGELESSLRRFVLEKRARSKLAPAKTYLMNLLGDLQNLASVNRDVAQSELDRVAKELENLEAEFEKAKKARSEASESVDHEIEKTASDVYSHTRQNINSTINQVGGQDLGVPYPGLWSAYQFADDVKDAMLYQISEAVSVCEEYGRQKTVQGYSGVKSLGLLHIGNDYSNLILVPERMFQKKRDALARQVDVDVDLWDFFDIGNLWERQEKVAGTGMAVTVAGVLGGRMIGGVGWVDGALGAARVVGSNNIRRLVIPGLITAAIIAISYAFTNIPRSLPKRLSAKLSAQLAAMDYTHANSLRISSEVRRALKHPSDKLRVDLQRNFEELQGKRQKTSETRNESEVAKKYFANLVRESNDIRHNVDRVDLEGPAPGVAANYDF
ncbi:MAG: mitofusin [Bathelium mastoideum]|nr:MAG: mitofusin [Bathelium mastoideum]KAI9687783.1 MAG: mitofusin [Bathelium mastoideum]